MPYTANSVLTATVSHWQTGECQYSSSLV